MVRLLHWLIRFYQIAISLYWGPRCRYIPTCSQYSLEAVHRYGAVRGAWLATHLSLSSLGWFGGMTLFRQKQFVLFHFRILKRFVAVPFS